jgi:Zn-dependent protease with chaperone function
VIGLAVISLVLIAAVAALASGAIGLALRWITPRLDRVEPRARTRVLGALLMSPAVVAAFVLLASLGPCLAARLAGLPDSCAHHGGPHVYLCLGQGGQPSALAWLLATVAVARTAYVLVKAAGGARLTSRLARSLRRLGSRAAAGDYFVVPGTASFTAGWPRSEVFVGSGLVAAVAPSRLAVVVAHERAHQRHRHVVVKLVARALTALHTPAVGRRLASELDVALEQTCDREAADRVGDPVSVAESLVAVARFHASCPAGALAGFTEGAEALDRRVAALCDPPWRAAPAGHRLWWALGGMLLLATALVFDRSLHDVTEALLQILGS